MTIFRWISHSVWGLMLFPFSVGAVDDVENLSSTATRSAALSNEYMGSGYLLQLIIGLLFVLLCIVVLAWLAKRVNRLQSSSDGALQVLGGISMGARERLVLVQVGSTQLLLGVAPGRISLLHQLDEPVEATGSRANNGVERLLTGSFSDKLTAALSRSK